MMRFATLRSRLLVVRGGPTRRHRGSAPYSRAPREGHHAAHATGEIGYPSCGRRATSAVDQSISV
jgi:hypothetical protein